MCRTLRRGVCKIDQICGVVERVSEFQRITIVHRAIRSWETVDEQAVVWRYVNIKSSVLPYPI